MSQNDMPPAADDESNNTVPSEPVDMTNNSQSSGPADQREHANEIYERLAEGRGQASTVVLETPHGEITCDVELKKLDRTTRWDCISALPDGMFQAAQRGEDASDITITSNVMPDGEGVKMIEVIVKNTLNPRGFSDGDWEAMIESDLRDEVLIEVGMGVLEMSFDRGEITGFRFE